MTWTDYTVAIRLSKPQWNRPVTLQKAVEQQKRLDESLGIKNPYLGMSFSDLKKLGRTLR